MAIQVIIEKFITPPQRHVHLPMPDSDALTEVDALQEAEIIDVRFSLDDASIGLLLDLRVALEFMTGNVAVLALWGVTDAQFQHIPQAWPHHAHVVMSSKPNALDGILTLEIGCLDGWRMRATAKAADFLVGDIPGLPEIPPDRNEASADQIAAGTPQWASEFVPEYGTSIYPRS
jgi:hypothetical protein